jgi:hypothetical protein
MIYYPNGDKNGLIAISLPKHRRIAPDSLFPKITLNNKLLALGMFIPILVLMGPTSVYAKHLSDSQRYNDGFNDGSQAAQTDKQNGNSFNSACDPQGLHTSDGQHTTLYCNGWADGYNSAWNGNSGSQSSSSDNSGQQQQRSINWEDLCNNYGSLVGVHTPCGDLAHGTQLTQEGKTALVCLFGGALGILSGVINAETIAEIKAISQNVCP